MSPCRAYTAMLAAALCGLLACAPAAGAQAPPPAASLISDPGAMRGQVTRVRGVLPDAPPGSTVQIQRLDPSQGWVVEAATTAAPGGAFVARWRPLVVGRITLRALSAGDPVRAAQAAPTAQLTVYRLALATWYGPGLYGRHTACGQVLSRRLLGVAHRTLPCGTPVDLRLGARSLTVPVVDRGPFGSAARYDLTSATAAALGVTRTTAIGVAPQRGSTMAASLAPPPPYAETGGTAPG